MMLDGGANYVLALASAGADGAEDGEIVRFGAAAGEHDFRRLRADELSDGSSRVFNGGTRAPASGVHGTGISSGVGEKREHRFKNFAIHGRRGVVIQIDAARNGVCLRHKS